MTNTLSCHPLSLISFLRMLIAEPAFSAFCFFNVISSKKPSARSGSPLLEFLANEVPTSLPPDTRLLPVLLVTLKNETIRPDHWRLHTLESKNNEKSGWYPRSPSLPTELLITDSLSEKGAGSWFIWRIVKQLCWVPHTQVCMGRALHSLFL